MKVVKLISRNSFFDFCRQNLPKSLRVEAIPLGYGYTNVVYRDSYKRNLLHKAFEDIGDAIATIHFNGVTLYHPEYFSDFEDVIAKYEAQKGQEITLTYHE